MLHFIYKDALVEEADLASLSSSCESHIADLLIGKLLAAADKYGLGRLRQLCETSLCKGISVSTVGEILALADCHNATELKAVCLRFAAENLAGYIFCFFLLLLHVLLICSLSSSLCMPLCQCVSWGRLLDTWTAYLMRYGVKWNCKSWNFFL